MMDASFTYKMQEGLLEVTLKRDLRMRRASLQSRGGEGHSKQRGQQVQRSWGCKELGTFKEQKRGSVWLEWSEEGSERKMDLGRGSGDNHAGHLGLSSLILSSFQTP